MSGSQAEAEAAARAQAGATKEGLHLKHASPLLLLLPPELLLWKMHRKSAAVHANFPTVTCSSVPSCLRTYLRGSALTSALILRPNVSFKPGWLHPVKSLAPIYRLQLLFVRQHTARPFQIPAHAAFQKTGLETEERRFFKGGC